jgi:hypothetical protein
VRLSAFAVLRLMTSSSQFEQSLPITRLRQNWRLHRYRVGSGCIVPKDVEMAKKQKRQRSRKPTKRSDNLPPMGWLTQLSQPTPTRRANVARSGAVEPILPPSERQDQASFAGGVAHGALSETGPVPVPRRPIPNEDLAGC